MDVVLKSNVFTDEQKVLVIQAILDKRITIHHFDTLEEDGDYYFVKGNKDKYVYIMSFKNGIRHKYFNSADKILMKTFMNYYNKYATIDDINMVTPLLLNVVIAYNKNTFYPYFRFDLRTKNVLFLEQGKNTQLIQNIISKTLHSNAWINFIEYAAVNEVSDIDTEGLESIEYSSIDGTYLFKYKNNSFDICYTQSKEQPKEQQKEQEKPKDQFMSAIDKFEDSETLKKTHNTYAINKYKNNIVNCIDYAIQNNTSSFTFDKYGLFSTPEITEFLKYICDTKKYTVTDSGSTFTIRLY